MQNPRKVPRQVPPIGQLRQHLTPDTLGPILSPLGPQSPPQPQADQLAAESIHDLSMEIYCRLAVDAISSSQIAKPELLMELARAAQQAAAIYFQSLGAQFKEGKTNG